MGVRNFDVRAITTLNIRQPQDVCYEDSIEIIHEELHKTRKSFVKIGWYLKHIEDNKMYENEGYENIVEFSKDKFNLSQSTTSRFIRVCEEFSINHNSPELDSKYEMYSVSQLIEMVSMKPEEKEQVAPEMTIRQIREVKKASNYATSHKHKNEKIENSIEENDAVIVEGDYREISLKKTKNKLENTKIEQLYELLSDLKKNNNSDNKTIASLTWAIFELESIYGKEN